MTATSTSVSPEAINALLNGDHGAPFDILGPSADTLYCLTWLLL